MRSTVSTLLLVAFLVLPAAATAQPPADMNAMVEEANRKLDKWIREVLAFVEPVRIGTADLESFLEHYESFSNLAKEEHEDEENVDFDEVLADPEYLAWATARGLAPEPWLRKSMRIIVFQVRDQMQAGFAQAEAQMPEQRRMIDEHCARAGEEICKQMKASLDASVAMFEYQKKRIEDLPQPTAAEQAAILPLAADVEALMRRGEEEWNEGRGEGDWEEDDWQER